jgi:hypothetical protein
MAKPKRVLDVRPDTLDFRDTMYTATLYEVPTRIDLKEYKKWKVPILDQGAEGACTGFGLATVANYLLRRRRIVPDPTPVSPWMLYEMAKRYDEWPGQDYEGSSARGAMKGWHKHGVCSETQWLYGGPNKDRRLTQDRTVDAVKRPLGAYYRVNHKDLVAMHAAMAEVGILYATASVHEGWNHLDRGIIPFTDEMLGGHAFAIVAYDARGFWIQNSWGKDWGAQGFGLMSYDDWLVNATDVWVARLGAPVILERAESTAVSHSAAAGKSIGYSYSELRPHIVSIGNNGALNEGGQYGTSRDEVITIFREEIPKATKDWKKKRVLLYAHGGLVSEDNAIQRLAEYRPALLEAQVYPISFVWHSDFWTTVTNILQDALSRRRPEGLLDAAKDFMLDRLDDALEPLARAIMGKAQWDEMKENAIAATESKDGGARLALELIDELVKDPKVELHVVGHSAGSIFHAPLVRLLTAKKGPLPSGLLKGQTGYGIKVESCTLWAPACTIELFKQAYLPAIQDGTIKRFALFTLTDDAEQDDNCANIYHKSLLYLVSNAFEAKARIPLFREGEPLLGMQKFVRQDKQLSALFKKSTSNWILAPNTEPEDSEDASTATHHGDFDDDGPTVKATLARILGKTKKDATFTINRSASSLRERRLQLAP